MIRFCDRIDASALTNAAARETRDRNALETILKPAIEAHLDDLISMGRLTPSEDLGARDVAFLKMWNAVVSNEGSEWDRVYIANALTMAAMSITALSKGDDLVSHLETMFDKGETPRIMHGFFWLIEATDGLTGERGHVLLENFTPSFWIIDSKAESGFRKAESIEQLAPISAEFTAPGGQLLFTDTLRVEGFSDATDFEPNRAYRELSLSTAIGRQARVAAHAEEHNYGYVQTTNTCVSVFKNPETGALIVTERWNDDLQFDAEGDYSDEIVIPGWTRLGSFSCDVWRATAIDRSVAAALIAPADHAAGEEALSAYLASGDCYADNIVTVPVKAGSRWRITCGDNFDSTADRKSLGLPEGLMIWALYEPIS